MIYDIVMFITFPTTMIVMGLGAKMNPVQWAGLSLAVIGMILMRVEL
jgi:membrane-bound ClpP family serine protease